MLWRSQRDGVGVGRGILVKGAINWLQLVAAMWNFSCHEDFLLP